MLRGIFFTVFVALNIFGMEKVLIDIKTPVMLPPLKNSLSNFAFDKRDIHVKPFFISKYETTVKEYKRYLEANSLENIFISHFEEDEPISNIDYHTAEKICTFFKGRLPTEVEWIAAAGVKSAKSRCYEHIEKDKFYIYPTEKFPLKENDPQIKCMKETDDEIEVDLIGSGRENVPYSYENINGTYGMLGNLWEWVDSEKIYFNKKYKIIKGGSYANIHKKEFFNSRVSNFLDPDTKMPNVGFRCAWDINNNN